MQRIYLVVLVLMALSSTSFGQPNYFLPCSISDKTVQYSTSVPCGAGSGIDIFSTQIGVAYFLRNDIGNAIVDGPIDGNGGMITLQTGPLTQLTNFNLYAEQRTEAVAFDGVDDYISVPYLTNLSGNAITIEFWFKGSDIQSAVRYQQSGATYVISGWNGMHILSNDGGTLDGLPVGAGVTDGNWHHVAMTWEINTVNGFKSYLDGVLVAQRNSSNMPITDEMYNLLLGAYQGSSEFMTGAMDQLRVWTVARSESEIQAGMNQCDMSGQSGLALYYQFEDGAGLSTVTDLSGNGNIGTFNHMNFSSSWVKGTTVCSSCNLLLSTAPDIDAIPVTEYAISTANYSNVCLSDTIVTLEMSQVGVDYYLRNDANNTVIEGPIAGTGAPISFNTGAVNYTTTFHVYGTNNAGCTMQSSNTVTSTILAISDQVVTTNNFSSVCSADTVIGLASSQIGVDYYLRDDADNSYLVGPIAGTGTSLYINTDVITATTTFNILAGAGNGCSSEMPNLVTITILPISDQAFVTNNISALCEMDTIIEIANSQVGVNYYMRDANDVTLDGPIAGTGGAIQFNTGVISASTVLFVDAKVGTPSVGIQFDGVDDFLADSSNYSNGYAGTYEAWVKFNSFAGNGTIVQLGSQNKWWVDDLGRQHVAAGMGGGLGDLVDLSGVQIPLGEWVHLAVYDYAYTFSADFYINGVKTYSTSAFTYTPDPQPQAIISFGGNSYPSTMGGFLDGSIDEVILWGALNPATDSIIQSHMNGCVDTSQFYLYEYYPMNEGSGLSTLDITSNPQTATMINGNAATMWTTGANVCGAHGCSLQLSDSVVVSILSISDEGAVVADMELCANNSGTTVTISNSQIGVDYFLRNDVTDAIVDGPIEGTGNSLDFSTGTISSSTTFNVYATIGSCSLEFAEIAAVTVYSPINGLVNQTICFNESVVVNGNTYNAAMPNGTEIIQVPRGTIMCDSTIEINLNVLPEISSSVMTTICSNESVIVNGNIYDAMTPTGTEVFTAANGCDSTVTINLNVLTPITGIEASTICFNESVVVNGTIYDAVTPTGTEVMMAANGCDSTVTINLNVIPAIDVTTNVSGLTIMVNEPNATYQWLDCGNGNMMILGANNQSFTASVNSDYAVIVTANNCTDTSDCVTIDNVGIAEQTIENLQIYPNPTDGKFVIDFGSEINSAVISIIDIHGNLIHSKTYVQSQQVSFILEEPAGVYILLIETGDKKSFARLVKE